MLRMILKVQTTQERVLAMYGKIVGSSVQLFKHEIESHLGTNLRMVLDLDGVSFIDEAGVALLHQWVGPRLTLRGGSPFLRALLAAEGLATH